MWCNVMMMCGHYLGCSLKSPHTSLQHERCHSVCSYWRSNDSTAQSGCQKNSSINPSCNRHASAAVIINVTLLTTHPLCQSSLYPLSIMSKRAGTLQCNDDCWTHCTCCRTGLQSYFFNMLSVLLPLFNRTYTHCKRSVWASRWRFQTTPHNW